MAGEKVNELTRRRIRRLYEEGVKQPALSERFGLTQGRISQILKEKDSI